MTAPLPSTALYVANACAPLIARWWDFSHHRPLRRLSANSFATQGHPRDRWLILIRRDTPAAMTRALLWPGHLAYVIDDDIAGAAHSPSLSPAYRARLDAFDRDWHGPLLARADIILASSDVLAERLAHRLVHQSAIIRRIDPAWHATPTPPTHYAALDQGAPFTIAHLGTASHSAALARLAPAIADILHRHPTTTFTYVAPRDEDPLPSHPRARRISPRPWPAWQRWLAGNRFHLALYPLMDEPFDRARSNAKLHEHAQVGAVGLYPATWAPADLLGPAALRAGPDPQEWAHRIEQAIAAGSALQQTADLASSRLSACKMCAMQQNLWTGLLGIQSG